MNIFTFKEDASQQSSLSDKDLHPPPHLKLEEVLSLAATIPNCCRITPPKRQVIKSFTSSHSSFSDAVLSRFPTISVESRGAFSTLRERFTKKFEKGSEEDNVLSFLVGNSNFVAADAVDEDVAGITQKTDIARIDVYTQTGTVCTIRVIRNNASEEDTRQLENTSDVVKSPSFATEFGQSGSHSPHVSQQHNSTDVPPASDTQVRRIFHRKVNLERLKRIFQNPPCMTEISYDIIQFEDFTAVSNAQNPISQSELSHAQQTLVHDGSKDYNSTLERDEKIRQQMANLVLTGGSFDDFTKLELTESKDSSLDENDIVNSSHYEALRQRQMDIQQKLELADMGLAILTGELEFIEKMLKQNTERDSDNETISSKESEKRSARNRKQEDKKKKTHRGREGKNNSRYLSERRSHSSYSVPVVSKRKNESFSTYEEDRSDNSDNSSLEGCEVEYSFPFEFHNELEDALLAQNFASDDDTYSVSDGDDSTVRGRAHDGNTEQRFSFVSVPTNGHGAVVLRDNGEFSVIGQLPKPLYKELFRKNAPYPEYIAIGTKGRYYLRFEDGTHKCTGPLSLKVFLNEAEARVSGKAKNASLLSRGRVKKEKHKGRREKEVPHRHNIASIAFGRQFDDFFLVRNDGSWECHGDMPHSLDKLLTRRGDRADLEWVSLGPNREWCLKAKNDKFWWGGVCEEVDDHLSRIFNEDERNKRTRDLKFIDFGVNGAFFLLYQ